MRKVLEIHINWWDHGADVVIIFHLAVVFTFVILLSLIAEFIVEHDASALRLEVVLEVLIVDPKVNPVAFLLPNSINALEAQDLQSLVALHSL